MKDLFIRQLTLLQLIPTEPASTTSTTLRRRMAARGLPIERRNLERQLLNLWMLPTGLQCVSEKKPYRWSMCAERVVPYTEKP